MELAVQMMSEDLEGSEEFVRAQVRRAEDREARMERRNRALEEPGAAEGSRAPRSSRQARRDQRSRRPRTTPAHATALEPKWREEKNYSWLLLSEHNPAFYVPQVCDPQRAQCAATRCLRVIYRCLCQRAKSSINCR